jgi:formylglycine-generating enzyme required for sulfatase activity
MQWPPGNSLRSWQWYARGEDDFGGETMKRTNGGPQHAGGRSSRTLSIARLVLLALALAFLAACAQQRATYREPLTGLRFVRIESGKFTMGSPAGEPGRQPDEIQHEVTISRAFYMSVTEVTQRQWLAVMGENPSTFTKAGLDAPVEQVTWDEVQLFLAQLTERNEKRFRLPTEAEWEYACRAGTTTAYAFGDRLSTADANYDGRYPLPGQPVGTFRESTVPAASFRPNAWGLFDMHGNVWEWCADEHCPYPATSVRDPVNACGSRFKVIRGGSWYFGADSARSALRYTHEPHLRGFSIGFRVVRDP